MAIDWTKPVETKDGRKVRVLATDIPGEFPVWAAVGSAAPNFSTYTLDGYVYDEKRPSPMDVVNTPVKKSGWINLYPTMSSYAIANSSMVYEDRRHADEGSSNARIACVFVEFTI